jgi:hypothetical protein
MTGIYEVYLNDKKVEEVGLGGDVERPNEIEAVLRNWWYNAKPGDVFKIRCELPD